jgi:hypothetical protein
MRPVYNNIQKFILLVVLSVMLFTTTVFADTPDFEYPHAYFNGSYVYDSQSDLLTFNNLFIQMVIYGEDSYGFGDTLAGKSFSIGSLYNDNANSMIFGSSSGGGTGQVAFDVSDIFSATLDNFVISEVSTGPETVSTMLLSGHIRNIFKEEDHGSTYMDLIGGSNLNLHIDFTPFEGFEDTGLDKFDVDSAGSLNGTLSGQVAIVPEPVSSVLFIVGGASLAFRRRFKNRDK